MYVRHNLDVSWNKAHFPILVHRHGSGLAINTGHAAPDTTFSILKATVFILTVVMLRTDFLVEVDVSDPVLIELTEDDG